VKDLGEKYIPNNKIIITPLQAIVASVSIRRFFERIDLAIDTTICIFLNSKCSLIISFFPQDGSPNK
jgi:hypothetical protein